jgi:hypothetical protein
MMIQTWEIAEVLAKMTKIKIGPPKVGSGLINANG